MAKHSASKSVRKEPESEHEQTPIKRSPDSVEIDSRDSKRATSSLGKALKAFERRWGESDEILLLEEMLKNKSKKTVDFSVSSLIGDSCPFGFKANGIQLKEKISKLKQKYKKNTEKVNHSAMKPHDVQVFNLSRKLWGDLGKGSVGKIQEAGPIIPFHTRGLDSAGKELLKEASELVQEPHPWQSSQPWLELRIEQCELFMKKIDLMKQQSKLEDKKFDLAKKKVGITAKNLKASLRTLSIRRPNEGTLSRHSIFGPNGLHGQWKPPASDKGVRYPSNIDFSTVEIPSVQKPVEDGRFIKKDENKVECQMPELESVEPENKDAQMPHVEEPGSLISFEAIESPVQTEIIRQPSPPPVLADVQDLIMPTSPPVTEVDCRLDNSSSDGLVCAQAPLELHISTALMDSFMRLAKSNTDKNLETCGVLAGSLKNRKFCVTALIIPKQESTSNSCQTTNEEEIFEVQDKQSLFPLGWIHTHPTQSCFMSSIDVHTHYSYQIMLPEAIAIVMAPRDGSRTHGIFRLTSGGMTLIRQCPRRGFHAHDPPADGSPIYKQCADVYVNPKLKFDVVDLR